MMAAAPHAEDFERAPAPGIAALRAPAGPTLVRRTAAYNPAVPGCSMLRQQRQFGRSSPPQPHSVQVLCTVGHGQGLHLGPQWFQGIAEHGTAPRKAAPRRRSGCSTC